MGLATMMVALLHHSQFKFMLGESREAELLREKISSRAVYLVFFFQLHDKNLYSMPWAVQRQERKTRHTPMRCNDISMHKSTQFHPSCEPWTTRGGVGQQSHQREGCLIKPFLRVSPHFNLPSALFLYSCSYPGLRLFRFGSIRGCHCARKVIAVVTPRVRKI